MKLNSLTPCLVKKTRKRVGRGIGCGSGKTCGRGHKGQKSRSGYSRKVGFEGGQMPLQRRIPKSGFSSRIGRVTAEVRLSELNKVPGALITLDSLLEANVISSIIKRVKIILSGEFARIVVVHHEALSVTAGARRAIEACGGKVE